jgi:hypothetical protein
VTLGPRMITPVTEATNARKSVIFSDLIASKPARAARACVRATSQAEQGNRRARDQNLELRTPTVHNETRFFIKCPRRFWEPDVCSAAGPPLCGETQRPESYASYTIGGGRDRGAA